jgi:hypothetical protein
MTTTKTTTTTKKEVTKKTLSKQQRPANQKKSKTTGSTTSRPATSSGGGGSKPKKTPSTTYSGSAIKSTTNKSGESGSGGRGGGRQRRVYNKVSNTLILVWMLVALELTLDLVTTIISFVALLKNAYCCEEVVDMGRWPLIFVIPFLLIILLELALLIHSIRLSIFGVPMPTTTTTNTTSTTGGLAGLWTGIWSILLPGGKSSFQYGTGWFRLINVLVLVNPFFGFLVAWMLLYQSSQVECFVVLGLEGASILLHWASLYLEGNEGGGATHQQTKWTMMVHAIPLIPFLVTVTVILVYLQLGGVCYLVEDAMFWYEGCRICPDGSLPDPNMNSNLRCPGSNSNITLEGNYCGDEGDTKFCFFKY